MAVEKLKMEIERKAKEELSALKKEHEAQYAAIKAESLKKSLQEVALIDANAKRECEEIALMSKESADLNARQLELLAREEAIDNMLEDMKRRIQKEMLDLKVLLKLFLKAKTIAQNNFNAGYFVVVNKKDLELARKAFGKGVEISEGAKSGVIIRSLDGSISVDMQIDTLINSNIAELRSDIASAMDESQKMRSKPKKHDTGLKTNRITKKSMPNRKAQKNRGNKKSMVR